MTRVLGMLAGAIAVALAPDAAAQSTARCDNCGTIVDIRQTTTRGAWTPLGSAVPGTGAGDSTAQPGRVTAQYQIGPQMKNQGMVLLGSAGGGGYAKRADDFQQPRWDLTVKMDANGGMRPISLSYEPPFRVGDRVHVYGTQLELLNP